MTGLLRWLAMIFLHTWHLCPCEKYLQDAVKRREEMLPIKAHVQTCVVISQKPFGFCVCLYIPLGMFDFQTSTPDKSPYTHAKCPWVVTDILSTLFLKIVCIFFQKITFGICYKQSLVGIVVNIAEIFFTFR